MSIKIKKCPFTADKAANNEVTKEDYLIAIPMHINDVQKGCAFIANKIIEAGINHDYTKIPTIDDFMEEPQFGKETKWYQAHINNERHHLNVRCPDDVTLIDVIEKLVDCTMAAIARKGYMTEDIISDEILQKAYKNTVEMLKREIIIEDD